MRKTTYRRALSSITVASFVLVAALGACDDGASDPNGGDVPDGAFSIDAPTNTSDASGDAQGGDADTQDGDVDAMSDAGVDGDAAVPVIVSTIKAPTAVDRVGMDFGAPVPDGEDDATVIAVIEGAFDGLTWVSTDADGVASPSSHQWDTLVDADPLPDVATGYLFGSQTWTIAVADGTTLLNDADGRVSVPAGTHTLTLSIEATSMMSTGQHFRLYARGSGVWVAGPVFVW